MTKNRVVLILGGLIIASLIATGCGGGGGGGGGTLDTPVTKEKPEYGGVLNMAMVTDPTGFDDAIQPHYTCQSLKLTNEELWTGDWTKGRAGGHGSAQCDWFNGGAINRLEYDTGALAESWEIPEKGTIIFHIREGVHWQNKAPVSGRELTVDDIVFSLNRQCTLPTAYMKRTYPQAAASMQVSAPDEHTVMIKCEPQYFGDIITMIDYMEIYPREAVEQFGNMNDWENSIGTGAFILTDYMPGSLLTFERNPDYWGEDPIGPGSGNQLPYIDGLKLFIMPDESTALAAFRTGKLDILSTDWELAQEFLKMPELNHVRYFDDYGQAAIYMRTDKPDSPFADKRVRQALYMAIDKQQIIDQYYGGEALMLKWPIMYFKEYAGAYVPLEELPASVQELYSYNPDKAKQLLKDAGYPDGFKATIICYNQRAYTDVLTMVKAMWAKVGVDLEIQPKDFASFTGILVRRAYDDMLFGYYAGVGACFKGINYTGTGMYNGSYIDDPVLNNAREEMLGAYPDEAKADQIHRELMSYLLEQAYVITLPAGPAYRFWWPWVKNYSGEASLGYYNLYNFSKYVWIDQTLKDSMVGK
jgi:peptide/nickel transport system substrate-binding protein